MLDYASAVRFLKEALLIISEIEQAGGPKINDEWRVYEGWMADAAHYSEVIEQWLGKGVVQ